MRGNVADNSGGGRRGLPRAAGIGEKLCVDVPQAARWLGLSRNFTYELVKKGELPSIRFGKRILIPRIALEKRLEKGGEQ